MAQPVSTIPVIRATAALVLASSERPLAIRADGMLRRASVRQLAARLAPMDVTETARLCRFLLPLLYDLELLHQRNGHGCVPTVAGVRFLSLPIATQRARLLTAWRGHPDPDAWFVPLLISRQGIVWPTLRTRLMGWASALPSGMLVAMATLHQQLAADLGPLADSITHAWQRVTRVPWQQRRAAAIFDAALRGPLTWLGIVTIQTTAQGEGVARVASDEQTVPIEMDMRRPKEQDDLGTPRTESLWQYGSCGTLHIPHESMNGSVVRLLAFARWDATDEATTTYQITRATLLRARRMGWSVAQLWALLRRHAGPIPHAWQEELDARPSTIQIAQRMVIMTDDAAVLDRAAGQRRVRHYLERRLAPGIAIAPVEQLAGLIRTLERQKLAVDVRGCTTATVRAHIGFQCSRMFQPFGGI